MNNELLRKEASSSGDCSRNPPRSCGLPSGRPVSSALSMSAPTVTSKDIFQPDIKHTVNQLRTVLLLVFSFNCSNIGFIGLGIIFFLSPRDTYLTL